MLNLKFGLAALALEISSWTSAAFLASRSDTTLLSYLTLHAAASFLLALSIYPLLWGTRSQPRWAVLSLIACFSFILPIVGWIAVIFGLLTIRTYTSNPSKNIYPTVSLPEFDFHQGLHLAGRSVGLRSLLNNPRTPKNNRFSALVALNHVSGHIASPMLRDVLNDESDDLRLLAYGMLDRLEHKIANAIHEEHQIFQNESQTSHTLGSALSLRGFTAAKRLSDLYWELIYQGLAMDDMHDFAAQESLHYCSLALEEWPDDGSLILRRGRLLQALGQLQAAQECYEHARQKDLPKTQIIPYQAQLHFERREYQRVKDVMHALKPHNMLPKLRPVIDFWS